MHRSGTSLLCGVLQRLGVALPGETIDGDQHNPEGYFEWDAVVAIQERLLIDLKRWWPAPEGTLALPDQWLSHPATEQARSSLRELLEPEVLRQLSLWAIKDPRCSRLLPLWLELARELDFPVQLLLAVRDPAEVIASLLRRDGPLTGMDANRAQQLWWRHNLEVVHQARAAGMALPVVDFGGWFQQPHHQLEELIEALPTLQPSLEQRANALALIKPSHRRSLRIANARGLDSAVRRLHKRLLGQPMPTRMPSPTPPPRLVQALSEPTQGAALASTPECWDAWLEHHRHYPVSHPTNLPPLAAEVAVELCGASWMELQPHLFMQCLPMDGLELLIPDYQRSVPNQLVLCNPALVPGTLEKLLINLELPPLNRRKQWLGHLRAQPLVFDPEPARVRLLQACGISVAWLDPQAPLNGWLDQTAANDPHLWARYLGLAPPEQGSLVLLGSAGEAFDRALAREASHGQCPQPVIQYLPGWPELIVQTPAEGLARAGWLQQASRSAVCVVTSDQALLESCTHLSGLKASLLALPPFTNPADLRARHLGTPLMALAEDRPAPPVQERFHWSDGQQPTAAVVISLFNYADRISAALESVAAQTTERLELIVVDDTSSDDGAEVVAAWMQAQLRQPSHIFSRLLLLCHSRNAGLATARNTAFAAAQAPWCLVLDADNALYPPAVQACLQLATCGDNRLAVVHPLLAVQVEPGRPDDQRSLVRSQSWQRGRFCFENMVDAMALVRRSAWEKAGGYTHIEGGWEDFDFWCKLIEAGFHDVQCPRILAEYRSHDQSMSHTATNSNWRALSRTLQQRHPWLQLPLASP